MVKRNKRGYTLIEMIAVIGIIALVISLTAGVLLSVVSAYDKQRVYSEIQRNGDFVMRIIEENIRNAVSVDCVEVEESVIVACIADNEFPDMLEIVDIDDTYYIGSFADVDDSGTSADNLCGGSENDSENNGFIFLARRGSDFNTLGYSATDFTDLKMTNDTSRGVNIERFEFDVIESPGKPTQVIVTMDVGDSICGSESLENDTKTFQSFVTVRGSYKDDK